ncbi:hypothetical protein [Bradyrhizobium erythrophlei]|uniref:Uncharacterized protein n=1 Tax=Bradyrhizobium erythrophlei TaxID=1437360 RepID=A0A1M5I952_9BRAD|nr:hypothetical protein [Bradyrhizobium erythrophlei]SHG24755.1 hypothetical protein SAMN05444169_1386 [Bradyrhizobium erythrophlei]
MCKIKGCEANAVGKGLCAKHYMRARRHGSTKVVNKRGPKGPRGGDGIFFEPGDKDNLKSHLLAHRIRMSPRTFERYWTANKIMLWSRMTEKQMLRTIKDAQRPNGSLNVSKLVRDTVETYVKKHPEFDWD